MNIEQADVDELITVANKFYDEAQAAATGMLESAWRSGEALVKIKATMKHGEWKPWIEANFHGSYDTASAYMRLASNIEHAELLKYDSIRAALKAIPPKSRPKGKSKVNAPTPNPKRPEMVDKAAQGKTVTEIAKEMGASPNTVRRELEREAIEEEAAPVDWDSIPGNQRDKLTRARESIRKELEREYRTRLLAEVDQEKARLNDKFVTYMAKVDAEAEAQKAERNAAYERYQTAVAAYKAKGLIPVSDYRLLYRCLHTDTHASVSEEDLNRAFHIITDPKVKALLVKE